MRHPESFELSHPGFLKLRNPESAHPRRPPAARIDGAGSFRTYWDIALPLVKPGLITLTILSFQGSWNEFSFFLVATSDPKYDTLTTGLAKFSSGSLGAGNQFPIMLGAALLSTIPVGSWSSSSSGRSSAAG